MIKSLLICDNQGIPFYSRIFKDMPDIDPALLSGLISAIGTIGKELFKEEIATIVFGLNGHGSKISVISKELFFIQKSIYFVFFYSGDIQKKSLRELSTTIFMETKNSLKSNNPNKDILAEQINKIIDIKFKSLETW